MPSYRGAATLASVVEAVHATLMKYSPHFEIILVIDGPDSAALSAAQGVSRRLPGLIILPLPKRVGTWSATTRGIKAANGKTVITIDDDGEYPAAALHLALSYFLAQKCSVVFGIPETERYASQPRKLRKLLQNWLANQGNTSSLRIMDASTLNKAMPNWLYIDAYLNWALPKWQISRLYVPHRQKLKRTRATTKGLLFAHALFCYRRPLRSMMLLLLIAGTAPFYLSNSTAPGHWLWAFLCGLGLCFLAARYHTIRRFSCPQFTS